MKQACSQPIGTVVVCFKRVFFRTTRQLILEQFVCDPYAHVLVYVHDNIIKAISNGL
jgi:hypothetical protein